MSLLKDFVADRRGSVSVDWIILTGVIVLTGLSVLGGLSGGIETASVGTATSLRGEIARQAFGPEACAGGVDALAAREAERIAAGGGDPIDVAATLEVLAEFDDNSLRAELIRTAPDLDAPGWTQDHTMAAAVECAVAARGLE